MRFPFSRYIVAGHSMEPGIAPGARVFINQWAYCFGAPRPGDYVVLAHPHEPSRLLVKKVAAVDRNTVAVISDHSSRGIDSRHFGPVPQSAIIGKVIARY